MTNTGPVPLTAITVTDPRATVSGCGGSLAVGASRNCSATHTVVAADLGAPYVNIAHVDAVAATGTAQADSNEVTVNFLPEPKIAVTMTSSPAATFTTLGQTITYTMTVRNTGNVPLSAVAIVSQTKAGASAASCSEATLAIGAQTTCTSTYTTNAADASGSVTNQATVRGTYAGTTVTAASQSVTVNSAVLCSVTGITANPSTVGRTTNGNGNKTPLAAPVIITVSTSGVCDGLRVRYYPSRSLSAGVVDNMSGGGGTWTFEIEEGQKGKSSSWDPGTARVDVLPSTGTTPLNTTVFTPFTVT